MVTDKKKGEKSIRIRSRPQLYVSLDEAGRDSSVGIATELRARRSEDRIPVEVRFSAHIQTGSGAHPASCTTSIGSFLVVKGPERGVEHPPPSSAEDKEKVELYLYSHSWPSWPVLG
jgi:hypothetical protein